MIQRIVLMDYLENIDGAGQGDRIYEVCSFKRECYE